MRRLLVKQPLGAPVLITYTCRFITLFFHFFSPTKNRGVPVCVYICILCKTVDDGCLCFQFPRQSNSNGEAPLVAWTTPHTERLAIVGDLAHAFGKNKNINEKKKKKPQTVNFRIKPARIINTLFHRRSNTWHAAAVHAYYI